MLFCLTAFQVSFYCPGTTEGEVDMTFSLNYTRIVSGSVDTEEIKSFMLTVRRQCEKTGNWHWIRHYHFAFLQGFFFSQIPCLFRSVSYETFKQSLTENYSVIIIIVVFAFLLFTLMKQFLACLDRSFKIYFCRSIIIFDTLPFTPMSGQDIISLSNINMIPSRQMMRLQKNVNLDY